MRKNTSHNQPNCNQIIHNVPITKPLPCLESLNLSYHLFHLLTNTAEILLQNTLTLINRTKMVELRDFHLSLLLGGDFRHIEIGLAEEF